MDEATALFRYTYVMMAAVAGAVTALAFSKWRDLTRGEIILTLLAGFSFAVFVTPWVAQQFLGLDDDNVRGIAALTYIFGSGSNILLPVVIRWTGRAFGGGMKEEPDGK